MISFSLASIRSAITFGTLYGAPKDAFVVLYQRLALVITAGKNPVKSRSASRDTIASRVIRKASSVIGDTGSCNDGLGTIVTPRALARAVTPVGTKFNSSGSSIRLHLRTNSIRSLKSASSGERELAPEPPPCAPVPTEVGDRGTETTEGELGPEPVSTWIGSTSSLKGLVAESTKPPPPEEVPQATETREFPKQMGSVPMSVQTTAEAVVWTDTDTMTGTALRPGPELRGEPAGLAELLLRYELSEDESYEEEDEKEE